MTINQYFKGTPLLDVDYIGNDIRQTRGYCRPLIISNIWPIPNYSIPPTGRILCHAERDLLAIAKVFVVECKVQHSSAVLLSKLRTILVFSSAKEVVFTSDVRRLVCVSVCLTVGSITWNVNFREFFETDEPQVGQTFGAIWSGYRSRNLSLRFILIRHYR